MQKKTRPLALCSVMAALSVVFLCLSGILPLALYACPILASATLIPVREDCPPSYGWCCFAAAAVLGLLLGPDKEAALLFCFLGYYPLLQPKLQAIASRFGRILAKLGLFSVSLSVMYLLILYVFRLSAVWEEFASTAPWVLVLTAGLGILLFFLYDLLLQRFALLYRQRRRRSRH